MAYCRHGCPLQIRRPNNYDPDVAMMLGPTTADPTMDLTALDIVKTVVVDSPNKLFVGGLPCEWAEDQARVNDSPYKLMVEQHARPAAASRRGMQLLSLLIWQPPKWIEWSIERATYSMASKPKKDQHLTAAPSCSQVKELLLPYGLLKAFNLVMDKSTGNSKARIRKLPPAVRLDLGLGVLFKGSACTESRCLYHCELMARPVH